MKKYRTFNKQTGVYSYFKAYDKQHAKNQLLELLERQGLEDSDNELESDWKDYYETIELAIKAHVDNFVYFRFIEYDDFELVKE